jgi:hypothetical protein
MSSIRTISVIAAVLLVASSACSLAYQLDHYADQWDPEAGTSDGATSDASNASDTPGSDGSCNAGFCACEGKNHSLCYDFDTPLSIAAWGAPSSSPGASFDFVDAGAISPPTSLLARVPATTTEGWAYLSLIEQRQASKVRLEADIVIEDGDTTPSNNQGEHGVCPMRIMIGPSESEFRVSFYADGVDFEQLVTGTAAGAGRVPIPTGVGTRGRVGIWVDVNAKTCGVTFDGQERLAGCTLPSGFQAGAAGIDIGILFVRPKTSAWTIRQDNVTIDLQ